MSKAPFLCHARRASIILVALAAGTSSCNMPSCENTNPTFTRYTPDKEEYKAELAKQINLIGESNLRYWLKDLTERNGQSYINVFVQGEGLCAVEEVQVNNWEKLKSIRETKGAGYSGAELKGLKVAITQTPTGTSFIYKDVDRIID